MANKRYDQFAAGSYDPLRILLTADPATGELKKVALSTFLGFKIAFGFFTQSGTSAPAVTTLINTLGGPIAGGRSTVGDYRLQTSGLWTANKTIVPPFLGEGFGYMALGQTQITDSFYNYQVIDTNDVQCFVCDGDFNPVELSSITTTAKMPFLILVAN